MKFHPRLVAISALLLILSSAGATLVIWDRLHTLYPTPEKESALLKNYSPQPVIEQFECNLPSSYAHPIESSAGRKFVTNKAEFQSFFAMRSDKWMPLMNTLNDDSSAQLLHNGAQILSQSGDPRSGFYFDYKLGNSIGTVTIAPLAITPPSRVRRASPLPAGSVEVTAHIELAEKWFPEEPGTIPSEARQLHPLITD